MMITVEVRRTLLRQWRWTAKAGNGEILASGESYHHREDLIDTLRLLFGAGTVRVTGLPGDALKGLR